ncbi:MAG: hypothetical protein K1X83_05415 [Oligoflexia bacterium]|nr:hypothetical protein [Oligoflexia bacterium]
MKAQAGTDSDISVVPWEPEKTLEKMALLQARLSRGFLRSDPSKWFPGFAMQWIPLTSAFGVELQIRTVEPVLAAPRGLSGYVGAVDDEPIAVGMEDRDARLLTAAFCSGALAGAQGVLREYLARRFITSMALSWSGPESSVVTFDRSMNMSHMRESAAIRMELLVNDQACNLWVLMGKFLVERLDALWRKQVRSTARQESGAARELALEVTQLAVPPSLLAEYMKPRAIIDLETIVSDRVLLREGGKPLSYARLVNIEGRYGISLLDEPVANPRLPDGTTRLAVELGRIAVDGNQSAEFLQNGAIWETGLKLGPAANMVINDEKVGSAELMIFEGRFALRVT